MYRHLPNIITLLNLFFGCCALVFIFQQQFLPAFLCVFLGGIADYTDGLIARQLNVDTSLGKELDSLADMVTFGIVPGAILYVLLADGLRADINEPVGLTIAALPAFILTIFAAMRLAKFNLDTRQTEEFLGLPTPGCTVFVVGLMLVYELNTYELRSLISSPEFLYPTIGILSCLLISEIPMFSMKFKGAGWRGNEKRYAFMALAAVLLVLFRELGLSLLMALYVLFSVLFNWMSPMQKQSLKSS